MLSNVLLLSRVTSLPRTPPLPLALLSRVHSEVVSRVACGVVMHDDTRRMIVITTKDGDERGFACLLLFLSHPIAGGGRAVVFSDPARAEWMARTAAQVKILKSQLLVELNV